jgi:hypothetical protein
MRKSNVLSSTGISSISTVTNKQMGLSLKQGKDQVENTVQPLTGKNLKLQQAMTLPAS